MLAFWFDNVFWVVPLLNGDDCQKSWIRLQHKIKQPGKQVAVNFHQLETP